jgi:hypothetical protein
MGTFGKVLAVLCVLAAIGFMSLAALNYGKRQAWEYRVQQENFIINGVPVDEQETDAEGQVLANLLGKKMAADLGVSEGATQRKEVEQRKSQLRSEIAGLPNDAAQRRRLETVLLSLARTWGEREALRREIYDPQVTVDALLDGPFERAFKEALAGKELALDLRRQAIAHVLFNLADTPEDMNRVAALVGLASYSRAVDAQAAALQSMIPEIRAAIEQDRAAFVVNYKSLLLRILALNERVLDARITLEKKRDLENKHQTAVSERQKDVKDLEADIRATQKRVEEALARQAALENELFATQRAIADADEMNQNLEKKIKSQELGR